MILRSVKLRQNPLNIGGFGVLHLVYEILNSGGGLVEPLEPVTDLLEDRGIRRYDQYRVQTLNSDEANCTCLGQRVSRKNSIKITDHLGRKVVLDRKKANPLSLKDIRIENVDYLQQLFQVPTTLGNKQYVSALMDDDIGPFAHVRRQQLGHFRGRHKVHPDDLDDKLVVR